MALGAAVRRYRELPATRRKLLREALAALLWSRLCMAVLPFRRLATPLEVGREEDALAPGPDEAGLVQEIGWAVQAAAGRVPWDSRCLAQALAAGRMLGRRGLDSTLFIGVRKDPPASFSAHAWLRCGGCFVTGGDGSLDHEVMGRFRLGRSRPGRPRP
jgi:hypothetical protein